ncbi:MAG: DUF1887 family protein [Lachnospiraceae bacterium]|nr:DUF1887 family protein [Lachnospiraceae bacterium]
MLQIQFLDYNVIDALVPAISLEPQHIIFIYDSKKITKKYTNNIEKALRAHLGGVSIGFVDADMYKISEIKSRILDVVADFKDERICIDITGGSEIMTAVGFALGYKKGYQIIYTNLAKSTIFDVIKEKKVADVKNITINDYLIAIGAKRSKDSHPLPKKSEYYRVCNVAEYLFKHIYAWHALQKFLANRCAKSDSLSFNITTDITFEGKSYKSKDILDIFVQNGFVARTGHNSYKFTSANNRIHMMNFGVWLEMYIYIKGQDFFDEIYLGVTLDWDNVDMDDTRDNEIDVIAFRKSIPVFISCKMKKPDAKDIYEVAYLADRLGGSESKAIIATTYNVSREKDNTAGLYQRFKKMNVGFIEIDSFMTHDPASVFNTAIQISL